MMQEETMSLVFAIVMAIAIWLTIFLLMKDGYPF
jgi:hypothetical protein